MPSNFSRSLSFDKRSVHTVFVPHMRPDGLYYEVNVKGYPRFFMSYSELGRYDLAPGAPEIPYALVLAASDAIEEVQKRR